MQLIIVGLVEGVGANLLRLLTLVPAVLVFPLISTPFIEEKFQKTTVFVQNFELGGASEY